MMHPSFSDYTIIFSKSAEKFYALQHERVVIYVLAIGHRKDIYQHSNFA